MKITKSELLKIIEEEYSKLKEAPMEEYRSHLTTDDVVKFYRMAGKPEPRSYYDIKMIARAYEQTPDGRAQIQRDIQTNTVQGLGR